MLTALLADIHGNQQALEACLDHAREHGADRYAFLGDYVGYAPIPSGSWLSSASMSNRALSPLSAIMTGRSPILRSP